MSVKMSDVFDLPMQQGDHQRFLLDSNDVYICETEYNNQSEAAKIAINTYVICMVAFQFSNKKILN